jgi:hypothetical protein
MSENLKVRNIKKRFLSTVKSHLRLLGGAMGLNTVLRRVEMYDLGSLKLNAK